jgi:hypothetical protein
MHARGGVVALLFAGLVACGGRPATKAAPPAGLVVPPAVPAVVDAPLAKESTEDDDVLRERVLLALDAGNLEAVEAPLRQLFGRAPRTGTRSLLDAVDATTGRDAVRPHPFANVRPLRVTELPPAPPLPKKPATLVAKRRKGASTVELGDTEFPAPEYRRMGAGRGGAVAYPDAIPHEFAGNSLLLVRPSAGRWLALYGRDRADARFVAVLREDGTTEALFDFAAWRMKIQIAEAGISWAELRGGTLYVKTEVVAFDGFIAAIELKTGKTLWRSEQVGFASNFVVGEDKIVAWRWQPRDSILALDRATGATVARLDTPYNPARVLVAAGGRVEAQGVAQFGEDEVYDIDVATTDAPPPPPVLGKPAPHKRVASDALRSPGDVERRRKAWGLLDADEPLGALLLLREVLDREPGNFAAGTLYAAAEAALAAAREQVGKQQVPVVRAGTAPPVGRAPIALGARPPVVRLVEEREYRRPDSAWFAENDVPPNHFSRDTAPSQYTVNPAPAWFADSLAGEARTQDVSAPDHAVGIYGYRLVGVYRDGKLATVLDFGEDDPRRSRGRANVMFADVVGDVVLVSTLSDKPFLTAADGKTGAILWRAPGIKAMSFVVVDGYVIAANGSTDVVVLAGDTGRIVQRVKTPKAYPMTYRLARKGQTLFGFDLVMTSRFALE